MKPASYCALLAGMAVWFGPVTAGAIVLSEDPLSGDSIDVGATARSFNYLMDGGLLDAPMLDAGTPGVSVADLRLRAAVERGDWLSLALHDSLTLTTSSLPLAAAGGPLALGQGRLPATLFPLDWNIENGDQLTLTDRIDWAYARVAKGRFSFTVGRQPVTFGRGALWSPEDLVDPFSPVQIDSEFKPGVDAARVDVTLGSHATLAVLGVGGDPERGNGIGISRDGSAAMQRIEVTFETTRVGVMTGYIRGDVVAAVDLFVDLDGADLHGEVTGTYVPDEDRRPFDRDEFARAVLGSTFQLSSKLNGTVEAYWNGSGASDTSDYEEALASPRLQSGETYNVGRVYLGAVLDWTAHPLVHIAAASIMNVLDHSALIAPSVHFSASNNTMLIAGAFVPLGASPDFSGATPLPRSEFALYPTLFHFDLKAYF